MNEINRADIVLPTAGRDKGKLMYVLSVDENGNLMLADGKLRRLEHPKMKKAKHVSLFEKGDDSRVAEKIRSGEKLTNSEIRKELARRTQDETTAKGG